MIDNYIFNNKKAAYFTLGCKLNFAETSALGKKLSEQGIRKALPGEKADICIINTCSVTELADKKCRQAIRRIKKQHPDSLMVVTGCYAQLNPGDIARIEGVDLILGTGRKADILEYLEKTKGKDNIRPESVTYPDSHKNLTIAVSPVKDIHTFTHSCSNDDRTRYFLKVQDGCDYYCSYCTIPFARGKSRNGKISDLVQMAEKVGAERGKEIILTGVNIGDFGKSTGENFFGLLQSLDKVKDIERFRISSIEPNLLTDEILDFIAGSQRFAPHFHIPLQSGSDAVLKLMRRKYDTGLFASKIYKIKELLPNAFIGVDVIVGVRGETDDYFNETERFIESLPVSQLHVFTYSERPGTGALKIDHVVDAKRKQERSHKLLDLSDKKIREFYRAQTGTTHKVLFEQAKKGNKMHGFTENYVKVEAGYRVDRINKITDITLSAYNEEKNIFCH